MRKMKISVYLRVRKLFTVGASKVELKFCGDSEETSGNRTLISLLDDTLNAAASDAADIFTLLSTLSDAKRHGQISHTLHLCVRTAC